MNAETIKNFVANIHNKFLNKTTNNIQFVNYYKNSASVWNECLLLYNNFLKSKKQNLNINDLALLGNVRNKQHYITGTLFDQKNNYVIRIREKELIKNEIKILKILKNEPQYCKVLENNDFCFISKFKKGEDIKSFLCKAETTEKTILKFIRKMLEDSFYLYQKYKIQYITTMINAAVYKDKILYFDLAQAKVITKDSNLSFYDIFIMFFYFLTEVKYVCNNKKIQFFESIVEEIKDLINSKNYK